MGSSCPVYRVGQSSVRNEISRLSGRKSKTIALLKRWSFLLWELVIYRTCDEFAGALKKCLYGSGVQHIIKHRNMSKQHSFRIPLAILLLCFCVGSLAFLPVTNPAGFSVLEVLEVDFEQTEFEEDLFVLMAAAITTVVLISLKQASMYLGFHPVCLSPISPPPKKS
jgi:hypothetical protein